MNIDVIVLLRNYTSKAQSRVNMYFAIILAIISTCEGQTTYRNYALVHGTPQNDNELKFFYDMEKLYNVTFWRRPGKVMVSVEFTISPKNYQDLMYDAHPKGIRFRTLMEDVQSAFDQQTIKRYTRYDLGSFTWDSYHSLDDIYNWMKDITRAYPEHVRLLHIGKSFENRDIFAVNLNINALSMTSHRPKVIVEGGSHGREWISPAVVTYIIHALLHANHSNSDELQLVAPMFDWILVPVMNPDGYVYSQTTDRLWHKNRRHGYGVDLNRNFGMVFGRQGAKTNINDAEYCGKEAFSEPESAAMAALARDNSMGLAYYLSFHSYGQYIIIPYSFSKSYEDNYNSTKTLADMMAEKILLNYQVQYGVGTNFDTQGYLASGVSADWAKRALNVTHVATFMLPDAGQYGFALPTDQILPTCQAIMDGLLAFLDPPNPEFPREIRRVKRTNSDDYDEDDDDSDETDGATLETHASNIFFFLCYMILFIF